MLLPILIDFPDSGVARGTVVAMGSHTPAALSLTKRPKKIELDPEIWVLSEKTAVVEKK